MNRFVQALYAAGHKSFDLPIERLVALLRIALTSFCFIAISRSSGLQPQYRAPFEPILIIYGLFAVGIALLPTIGKFRTGWQLPVHFLDVGVVSILTYSLETNSAVFFVLYVFVLMSAAFRWNWRGALLTTIALPVLQVPFFRLDTAFFGDVMLQWVFLLIIGGVFVFFGVSRERNAENLARIAEWPNPRLQTYTNVDDHWLDASLRHIADVFEVPRLLLLWEIEQEPYCFSVLLAGGKCQNERALTHEFDSLIAAELGGLVFAAEMAESNECLTLQGSKHVVGPILAERLRTRFSISSACSAPFSSDSCKGRLFILDRSHWGEDDLILAEIVASRLHLELEYYAISVELKETAASRERIRLARDLHDGVLQTLTGAALQLSSIASPMSKEVKQRLNDVRELLVGEQQRIREFVEGRRLSPRNEYLNLHDEMQREIARIERQWGCRAKLSGAAANEMMSLGTIRQLQLIVAEAAANAVQHGKASHIDVTLEPMINNIRLRIADNGRGLPGETGTYDQDELAARVIGPRSIANRVAESGGTLSLSTSSKGIELSIQLPCTSQPAQQIHATQAYSLT